jgi:UDP-N-acetylmuramoylalanine--D-glutamate ligase
VITARAFAGKHYAVYGLARSGLATVEALLASGAKVTAWDDSMFPGEGRGPGQREPLLSSGLDPGLRRGTEILDLNTADLSQFDSLVVTPGLPLNRHPIAARAREAGLEIIGDIELFARARPELPPHKVVGITGTNGKSTTTALIHHILQTAGVPSAMGGNIGLPILGQDPLPEGGVYVLELSSYQIDLTFSLDCDVAVLLNVTPDHLDRYESFQAYARSKGRLFQMQDQDHRSVVAIDSEETQSVADSLRFKILEKESAAPGVGWISSDEPVSNSMSFSLQESDRLIEVSCAEVLDQSAWPSLQGPHNAQNAAAAIGTCRALGLSSDQIEQALRTYPGLSHRMERVAEKHGVLFVNDSKATNADSTAPALAAYPHTHWIVGGRAKTEDLGPCEQHLDHVRAAYTIGEAGPMFFRLLDGRVPTVTQSGTLDRAVKDAVGAAKPGEVVLLSPACASFDQFRDYEHRGQAFREAVEALP